MIDRVAIGEEDDDQVLSNEVVGNDRESKEAENDQEGGLEEVIKVEEFQYINPQ